MPLTTRCRHCGRLFPVYATELKANRSRVHCPQCGKRFNAVAGLIDEHIPQAEDTNRRRHPARRAVTATLAQGPGPNEIPVPRRGRTGRWLWGLGVLALCLALVAQFAWWARGELIRYPQVQSLLGQACALLDCQAPLPRLPGTIEILQSTLAADLDHPEGLALRLVLVSRAHTPQRAPILEVELFDADGALLAARRFAPAAYLTASAPALTEGLRPRRPTPVSLTLSLAQAQPMGFRVRLL